MPNYEYVADCCQITWEIIQEYSDDPIDECPVCHDKTQTRRVFSIGYIGIKDNNTLGAIAESNRKKLGGEYDNIVQKMANERSSTFKGKIPDGASQVEKKKGDRPFWRPDRDTPDFALTKATDAQLTKYVMEGKRPIGT